MSAFQWRPLRRDDLEAVASVAALAFPDHYEAPACFAERLRLSPSWCFALEDGRGELEGYLLAWPWPLGSIPPLNRLVGSLAEQDRGLFIHDLALRPQAAGRGLAGGIVRRVIEQARSAGFEAVALVAVNDTTAFWRRQGFGDAELAPEVREKLAAYGESARYMVRPVNSADQRSSSAETRD